MKKNDKSYKTKLNVKCAFITVKRYLTTLCAIE